MKKERYFVKSFEDDFVLKTLNGEKKVDFQSIKEILIKKIINPNTVSFGKERRLACTTLHKNYLKTYRPQGLIFKTSDSPDYIAPLDLVLLTRGDKIVVQYYRIKNNLHLYYNQNLIEGFDKFIFKSLKELLDKFPNVESVWKEVNEFRVKSGFKQLPKSKYRLVEYNESIFHNPITITPVAIFGYTCLARQIAKTYELPCFRTAKEFYKKINNSN